MSDANRCPNCQQRLPIILAAFCSVCGHAIPRPDRTAQGDSIRRVADRQRILIWVVLLNLILQFAIMVKANLASPAIFVICWLMLLCTLIATFVSVLRLAAALGWNIVALIALAPLCLVPLVNLLLMLLLNSRATTLLRAAGIRVGFLGARKSDVHDIVSVGCCRQCGYDLTGLTSGRCPECGLVFAPQAATPASS